MASRGQFPFQLLPLPLPLPGSTESASSSSAPPPSHTYGQTHLQSELPQPLPQPSQSAQQGGMWSEDEHDRFLEAMQFFPQGPWRDIAAFVGTRSVRQVQTHAQKYHEKIARRLRGLRKDRKRLARPEHRIDDDMMSLCRDYSIESVAGPHTAPPATLWNSYGDLLAPRTHRQQPLELEYRHTPQHQQTNDPMLRDYRAYDYIAYIEEEFAYRDAAEEAATAEREAAAAAAHATTDLPAFSDCLDYLIDVFGSNQLHHTAPAWRMQRHRL